MVAEYCKDAVFDFRVERFCQGGHDMEGVFFIAGESHVVAGHEDEIGS